MFRQVLNDLHSLLRRSIPAPARRPVRKDTEYQHKVYRFFHKKKGGHRTCCSVPPFYKAVGIEKILLLFILTIRTGAFQKFVHTDPHSVNGVGKPTNLII